MINFKQYIAEKWVDGEEIETYINGKNLYIEIFVNPSRNELNECGSDCRGVIDKKGNLYLSTKSDFVSRSTTRAIHTDIIEFLQRKKLLPQGPEKLFYGTFNDNKKIEGVTVQRVGNKMEIAVGESVVFDKEPSSKLNEQIYAIIDASATKNKHLKFYKAHIHQIGKDDDMDQQAFQT